MKKTTILISVFLFFILINSCICRDLKSKDEIPADSLLSYISDNYDGIDAYDNFNPSDTIDFSKIEISDDSTDLALFNLILEHENYSETKLSENIVILVNKGANPNAVIEYQYSVRKLGTYIPIIKHFYNNKYRTYTANSTAFHEAVNSDKQTIVLKFIELKADVNYPSRSGVYPIDIAIENDNDQIVQLLIDNGCNVSSANLALSENIDMIEKLVKLGADPRRIAIDFALEDVNILKRVLALGPDLSDQELDYSLIFNNEEILDVLLDAGIGSNIKGKFPDNCPLIYGAIKYGDVNTVKKLKKAGVNIKLKCSSGSSETPLFYAIYNENPEIVKYYLNEEKVSPNQKDWTKKSALLIAISTNNDELVNILLEAGASIEYSGYFGKSPLIYAVDYDHYIAAQTLINRGANLNFKGKYGDTPLSVAVEKHNLAMVKLLVESGADIKSTYKGMKYSAFAESKEAPNMIIQYLKGKE
jgi:ankyrin repeat protein